jgi:hypothetical protein
MQRPAQERAALPPHIVPANTCLCRPPHFARAKNCRIGRIVNHLDTHPQPLSYLTSNRRTSLHTRTAENSRIRVNYCDYLSCTIQSPNIWLEQALTIAMPFKQHVTLSTPVNSLPLRPQEKTWKDLQQECQSIIEIPRSDCLSNHRNETSA